MDLERLDYLASFQVEVKHHTVVQAGQSEPAIARDLQGMQLSRHWDLCQLAPGLDVPDANAAVSLRPATGGDESAVLGELEVVYWTGVPTQPARRRSAVVG